MKRWVVVAAIGVMTSLYGSQQNGGVEQRKNDGKNSASQEPRPEVKNRYHKRGDELLAEIESNMSAARQYSAPKDEQLAESIRTKVLDSSSDKYDRIGVIVNRGHVSLWGEVPTQQDKEFIEGKVRQMGGVLSFNNQLTVAGHSGEGDKIEFKDRYNSRGDEEIIKRIRDKLSGEPLWNQHLNLELDVYDGIVTVKGNVKGVELQRQVVDLINQVQGVRGVNNHLEDR